MTNTVTTFLPDAQHRYLAWPVPLTMRLREVSPLAPGCGKELNRAHPDAATLGRLTRSDRSSRDTACASIISGGEDVVRCHSTICMQLHRYLTQYTRKFYIRRSSASR